MRNESLLAQQTSSDCLPTLTQLLDQYETSLYDLESQVAEIKRDTAQLQAALEHSIYEKPVQLRIVG